MKSPFAVFALVAGSAALSFVGGCAGAATGPARPSVDPASPVMLKGAWVPASPDEIDFDKLPRVPVQHAVVSDVAPRKGVNQHNYLIHHGGRFWAMWSDGPEIEDRVGQVVKYATSLDGLKWSEPKFMTGYPRGFTPESPLYNTRKKEGFRYISRGFWVRDNQLLALVSLDEAAGFFGESLELRAFRWNASTEKWDDIGVVHDDAINNFPPQKLPSGEWAMTRRRHDYKDTGVQLIIGGVAALDQWTSVPVVGGVSAENPLKAEEPIWYALPDGKLVALFRDNGGSKRLFRGFSLDNGRTWTTPVKTDFPDARSKLFAFRLKDGRYALVSNSNPKKRDPLTLALSDDGIVYDRLFYVVGGRHIDYPHMIEHDGYLYIAHSGAKRSVEVQKVRIADLASLRMPGSVK